MDSNIVVALLCECGGCRCTLLDGCNRGHTSWLLIACNHTKTSALVTFVDDRDGGAGTRSLGASSS